MYITFPKDTIINVQKINIFRFPNCMEMHEQVLSEKGTCSFGRFGKRVERQPITNDSGYLLFYQHGKVFLTHVIRIEKEAVNYPGIYEDYFFKNGLYPVNYLLLDMITEIDAIILSKLIYLSNRRIMSRTISRCNNAFITGSFIEDYFIST
ncbi:hypothetical protein [Butyrivibrio sp. WCD3002]|uniref:hypothetical protein n=1 Tax=Butyrivibrio sp. WCD3002 TaxID=1280676 RepID=UPI00047C37B1|nr:hypothetical protein [Butyrivibrio sp. WCD3002]